ncbi:DMT family transporter [Pleomorphomonas sp. PLEO]|uniref:DMT family transporter n=1 Tax=Pleomorphomonas sp. PLEO TaxID=3239306 RepID=UPI00351EE877
MSPTAAGVLFKLASTIAFAFMLTLIKLVSGRVPPGEVLFARSFFGIVPVIVYLAALGVFPASLRTARPLGHVRRSLVGTASMFCWFTAVSYLPLPDATAISYSGPLFGVCLAALVLHERVRAFRWGAVGIGFLGVLIVLSGQLNGFEMGFQGSRATGAICALASAVLGAFAAVTVRELTATETTGAIVFYFLACGSAFSFVTIPFGWVVPSFSDAAMLIVAGLFGGIGQVLMTQSYRLAEASVIAPLDYINMIWIVILSYLIFGDVPTAVVLAGSLVVIASGVFVVWRERRLGILEAKAKARSADTPT